MNRSPTPGVGSKWRAALPWLWAALAMSVVVLLDQLSKAAVRDSIVPGESRNVLPGIQLVNSQNHGVAFGFFPGRHTAVTVLVVAALVILLLYFAFNHSRRLIWLPTGMVLGGAVGNIADRVRTGSVTDFVKLPLNWPAFNLADVAITVGVLLLLVVAEGSRGDKDRTGINGDGGENRAAERLQPTSARRSVSG